MKLAAAGLLAVIAIVVAAFVVAVRRTDDDTPGEVRDCLRGTDAIVVRGSDGLSGLRRDLVLKTPPRRVPLSIGDRPGMLLEGTGYRVLVVTTRKSPSLAGDVASRVYRHADAYPLVAVEPAASQGMVGCARAAR